MLRFNFLSKLTLATAAALILALTAIAAYLHQRVEQENARSVQMAQQTDALKRQLALAENQEARRKAQEAAAQAEAQRRQTELQRTAQMLGNFIGGGDANK
jgi:septal ring factor EnvC (AmiA/AmiB activator)